MIEPPNAGLTEVEIAAVVAALRRGTDHDLSEDELVDQVEEFDNRIVRARVAMVILKLIMTKRLALWWDSDIDDFRMRASGV